MAGSHAMGRSLANDKSVSSPHRHRLSQWSTNNDTRRSEGSTPYDESRPTADLTPDDVETPHSRPRGQRQRDGGSQMLPSDVRQQADDGRGDHQDREVERVRPRPAQADTTAQDQPAQQTVACRAQHEADSQTFETEPVQSQPAAHE